MTITFDQLIENWVEDPATGQRLREPEPGFDIQGHIHTISALISEWQRNNLTGPQLATLINLDTSEPEVATVKTFLGGLSRADTLSLQDAMILAEAGIYDKALLRTKFGL